MDSNRTSEWAIIGGGMMGMTLAHRLAQRGQHVTLIEAAPTLGGLTSAWRLGDVTWDRFYHVILLSDTFLRDLLEEIGLVDELRWVETKTGFFSNGQLYSMSNGLEFLGFPPLTFVEKIRLGATIFYASKIRDWRSLENVPVADWLRKISGEGVFNKIWLPLLKAKLGETYRDVSAAFIWAHINRMYQARRSGLKKEMFGYVRGGYARIIDRLAETLREEGVEIVCSAPVQSVRAAKEGGVDLQLASQETRRFDQVVFTTPSPAIAEACPDMEDEERCRFEGVRYLGVVCASLLLKKPISQFYVTNIIDTWVPLTAVIEMSAIVDRAELEGHSLVYLPKYVPSESPLFEEEDDAIREHWLDTLEKMYSHFSRDHVAAFQISRARKVMALPTIDYSTKLPPMRTSIPGVFAVNSAHILKGNLNVNETIQIAEDALQGVLAETIASSPSDAASTIVPASNETALRDESTHREPIA